MAAVTFTEAAAALGFKSRSTLYRLRDEDQLRGYLVRPVRPGLAYRLETAPVGLPTLQEHVSRCIRPQATNDYGARHGIAPAPAPKDPRAAKAQVIATGFHRNTVINQEGGVDP